MIGPTRMISDLAASKSLQEWDIRYQPLGVSLGSTARSYPATDAVLAALDSYSYFHRVETDICHPASTLLEPGLTPRS